MHNRGNVPKTSWTLVFLFAGLRGGGLSVFAAYWAFAPVDRFDMGVRLILRFSWLLVVETLEGTKGDHGDVHYAVVLVLIQI